MNAAGEAAPGALPPADTVRRVALRVVRWSAGLLAALLLLVGAALIFRDAILKAILAQRLRHEFGFRVEVGELKTGLGSTFVHVRDLKVFNAPEFGGTLLAEAPELFAQFDTDSLSEHLVRLKELRVNLTEFNVVRNAEGRTNLEKIEKAWRERIRRKKKKEKVRWDFAGIDQLQVNIGKVGFADLRRPALNREFQLDLRDEKGRDLKDEEQVQGWAGLLLIRLLAQDAMRPAGERKLPSQEWLLNWASKD